MALRVPLFRRPPDRSRAEPTAKRSRTTKSASKSVAERESSPKSAPKAGARSKRTSKSAPKSGAAPRPTPRRAPKSVAEPQPASRRAPKTAAGPKPSSKRAPKPIAKQKPSAKRPSKSAPKSGAKPPSPRRGTQEDRPRIPLLQRRSAGALLARAAVLVVALVAMVAFAVALAKVTLVSSPSSDALVHTNLRPGASIRAYLDQPALRDSVKQIGGNILLGVPFGVLLPALFPRTRGLVRVALVTALVMVLVETAQGAIVEGRAFDIDDVILNTFGALLGYLPLGRRLGRALHPRRTHWWHRLGLGTPPRPEQ